MKIVWNGEVDDGKSSTTIQWGTVFTGSVLGVSSLFLKVAGVIVDLKDPANTCDENTTVENFKEINAVLHVDAAEE